MANIIHIVAFVIVTIITITTIIHIIAITCYALSLVVCVVMCCHNPISNAVVSICLSATTTIVDYLTGNQLLTV